MAVSLSALRAGRPLPPGIFPILISVRGRVNPRVIVRLEGLGQLKIFKDLNGNLTRNLPARSINASTNYATTTATITTITTATNTTNNNI
jgi:hypothetical protein